jgi:hypothetical protein
LANWLLASGYGLQGETTKLLGPVFKFARRKADNDYGYDYVDELDPWIGAKIACMADRTLIEAIHAST